MADKNTIVQRIALDGADEIKKALEDVGQAGEAAFAQLKAASQSATLESIMSGAGKAADVFSQFGQKLAPVGASLSAFMDKLGNVAERVAAFSGVAGAVGTVLAGLGKQAGTAAADVGKQAEALGLTVSALEKYKAAAAQAGVPLKAFDSGFQSFVDNFQKGVDKAKDIAVDLAKAFNESRDPLALEKINPATGFIDAPKPPDTTSLDAAAKRVQEINASLGNTVSFKFVRDRLEELSKTSDKVRQQIEALGAEGLPKNLLESLDRLKSGVTSTGVSLGPVGDALRKMGVSLVDAKGVAISSDDAFKAIADRFKTMPDGAEKTALAMKLFGKSAGPDLIPLLNQGRAGIERMGDGMVSLGLGFDKTQVKAGKDMVGAFARLSFAADAAKNQLGIVFTPVITQGADYLTNAITRNFSTIKEWAGYLGGEAKQALADFAPLIEGRDADVQNSWMIKLRDGVVNLGSTISAVVTGVVVPLFNAINTAANGVASVINQVFGTQFTGASLLGVAAIMRVVGVFGLIGSAATLATTVVTSVLIPAIAGISGALVAFLFANPFIALVAGAFALGAAIAVLLTNVGGLRDKLVELVSTGASNAWQWISDGFVTVATAIGSHIIEIATGIANLVTTGVSGAWQWLSDSFDAVVNYIQGKFQAVVDFIRGLGASVGSFFSPGQPSGSAQPAPGHAAGGLIRGFSGGGLVSGAGSSTSDSIPVRLSAGEFVMRAAAVVKYGLNYMNAINDLQMPEPKFAFGGLVDRINVPSRGSLLPRFADGGQVRLASATGLHPVTLNLDGGRKVGGLFAAPDAVTDLRKAAFMQQISATGKRSSSVG